MKNKNAIRSCIQLCLLLFVLLAVVIIPWSSRSFEDPVLEEAVRKKLGRPKGPLRQAELLRIKKLDLRNLKIRSLEGISHISLLREIDLSGNPVLDLQPLGGLKKLQLLNLRAMGLKHLHTLPALPDLQQLDLRGNRLREIDSLAALKELQVLDLRDNLVRDISPISGLRNLTYLNLRSNVQIESLTALENLVQLESLNLTGVPVTNQIGILSNLYNLQELKLRDCGIKDVTVLVKLMRQGALQDRQHPFRPAELDLRENPVQWDTAGEADVTGMLWANISTRKPEFQPAQAVLPPPNFSHPGGIYTHPLEVELSHRVAGTEIVYTVDGSLPDRKNQLGTSYVYRNSFIQNEGDVDGDDWVREFRSHRYRNPLVMIDRTPSPNQISQISSTITDHDSYKPKHLLRKGTTLQARAYAPGRIPSRIVGHTFFIFPEGNPYQIPLISLTIQENYLFDYDMGVYTAGSGWDDWRREHPDISAPHGIPSNFHRHGRQWEYPARLEVFEPTQDAATVNQMVGFRIHGFYSRRHPVKHMRFYARREYDVHTDFQHAFFNSYQDMSRRPEYPAPRRLLMKGRPNGGPFLNDLVVHKAVLPFYSGVSRIRPSVHFINGEFWGITSLRDRIDRFHFASQTGLEAENIIMTEGYNLKEPQPGDREKFRKLIEVLDHPEVTSYEQKVSTILDLDSFFDQIIANIFFANSHHEFGFWRVREIDLSHPFGDGRWRTYSQDFDNILQKGDWLATRMEKDPFFKNLLSSPDTRDAFVRRFCDHVNTSLRPEKIVEVAKSAYDEIKPYLDEDANRWNFRLASPHDVRRFSEFAHERPEQIYNSLRANLGLNQTVEVTLQVDPPRAGHILINGILLDKQNQIHPAPVYPWKGTYFQHIPIRLTAVSADGFTFKGWEQRPFVRSGSEGAKAAQTVLLKHDVELVAVFSEILEETPHEFSFR